MLIIADGIIKRQKSVSDVAQFVNTCFTYTKLWVLVQFSMPQKSVSGDAPLTL